MKIAPKNYKKPAALLTKINLAEHEFAKALPAVRSNMAETPAAAVANSAKNFLLTPEQLEFITGGLLQ